MNSPPTAVAVIPARGGSKRIPRKNCKLFAGAPMISYAIKAAVASNLFTEVIVSTDDSEIAQISVEFGAKVPFVRPADLSDDFVPTVPVIRHAIDFLTTSSSLPQIVCCIYPCVPFLQSVDLVRALTLLESSTSDYCFPVAEHRSAVQRSLRMDQNGVMSPLFPESELTRTQDLEKSFYDVGQFYWGSAKSWLTIDRIHSSAIGYEIDSWRAIDIDTESDWARAEKLYLALKDDF